ncbi:MAG: hypothetical protein ABI747_02795 [Candidatus Moraniibacteriota bacterium]
MRFSFKFKPHVFKNIWHAIMDQWIKRYKLLFFFTFLIASGIGGFQWYRSLETYHWSPEEKKAYLDRTVKETSFQEQKFKEVLGVLSGLDKDNASHLPPIRDIFLGKKKKAN